MSRRSSSRHEPYSNARHVRRATLALIGVGPLALGGTDPVLRAVFCGLALLLFAGHMLSKPPVRRWPGLTWAALGVGAWTLVRTLPGTGWLAAAPIDEMWALWPDLTARGTAAPGFAAAAALRCAAVAALAAVCASRFATVDRLGQLGRAVIIGGLLAALVGVVQDLFGADARYFVFAPRSFDGLVEPLAGPWVNPNQAGAYVGLCGVLSAGLVWIAPRQNQRFVGFVGAVGAVVYAVAVSAWAAVLALVAAIIAILVSAATTSISRHPAALKPVAWAAVIGSVVLGIVAHAPNLVPTPEFVEAAARGKVSLWRGASELILAAPWTGWGVGAFADAIPRFAPSSAPVRYAWAESLPLQVAFDHGIPVLIAAGIATLITPMMWIARRGRGAHAPWRGTAIGTGVFLIVEAIFGMGLHGAAHMFAAAALVGSVSGLALARRPRTRDEEDEPRVPRTAPTRPVRRWRTPLGTSGILALAALAALGASASVRLEIDQHHPFDQGELPSAEAIARRAADTPGDPRVIGAAAYRALEDGDLARAQQLASYVAERAPRRIDTWSLAAAIAITRGDDRALCEATRRELSVRLSAAAVDQIPGPVSTWLQCIPDTPEARQYIYDRLREEGRHSERMALAMRRLQLAPDDASAAVAAGLSALELDMVEPAAYWADTARARDPHDAGAWWLAASVERRRGDDVRELALLDEGIEQSSPGWLLRAERVRVLLRMHDGGVAPADWIATAVSDLDVLSAGSHMGDVSPRVAAELRTRLELARGNFDRAAASADAWLVTSPNDTAMVRLRLRAAVSGGDPTTIIRYAERLLSLVPNDSEARRALETVD